MDSPTVPSADGHWAPDHLVLARHVLAHAGRLFVERDASGVVLTYSPLAGMAAVEQRYPPWALGPFGRIEPEYALPESPGVYALVCNGVVHYVGATNDVSRLFGVQKGVGHISRRDCRSRRAEERCRLNRLITTEAVAGRPVDLYLLRMPAPWTWKFGSTADAPSRVVAEIVASNRGDWHLPE